MNKITVVTIIIALVMTAAILVLRYRYEDSSAVNGNDIAVSGLTNGIAVEYGNIISGIRISVPVDHEADDLISVSSDPEIGYLKIQKGSDDSRRIIEAEFVTLKTGIVEVYVKASDGKTESKRYTVNVVSDDTDVTPDITEETNSSAETLGEDTVTVYVTPNGKKYHLKASCAGKNAISINLEDAVSDGYDPCKVCATVK